MATSSEKLHPKIKPIKGTTSYIRMALVCASGWGKTCFGATAPRALFLTTDPEGTLSAFTVIHTDAMEWKIFEWQDMEDAYAWIRDHGCEMFEWVIVDNGSEAQNLAKLMSRNAAVRRNPKSRMMYSYDKPDYGVAQEALTQLVLKMHDLPIHVLWTFHMKGMEDESGESFYSAAIQGGEGAVAQRILGYMNIIGMGEVLEKEDKEVRRIWFTHANEFRGKDRFNALGRFRDDLTIPRMMTILSKSGALAGAIPRSSTRKLPTKAGSTTRKKA